jgi:hypothetical protein
MRSVSFVSFKAAVLAAGFLVFGMGGAALAAGAPASPEPSDGPREVALERLVLTLPFTPKQATRGTQPRALVTLVFRMAPGWVGPEQLTPTSSETARFLDRLNLLLHAEGFGGASTPLPDAEVESKLSHVAHEAAKAAYGDTLEDLKIRDLRLF